MKVAGIEKKQRFWSATGAFGWRVSRPQRRPGLAEEEEEGEGCRRKCKKKNHAAPDISSFGKGPDLSRKEEEGRDISVPEKRAR